MYILEREQTGDGAFSQTFPIAVHRKAEKDKRTNKKYKKIYYVCK